MDHEKNVQGKLKVICPVDCGNAPKKLQLKQFNIAFARNDVEEILLFVTDDVQWDMVGKKCIQGKDHVAKTLEQMRHITVSEIQVHTIITHGKSAAVNGTLIFDDAKSYAFCDVYFFNSAGKHAKIKEISSYVIEM